MLAAMRWLPLLLVVWCIGCGSESLDPAPLPACYERASVSADDLCALLPDACPKLTGLPAMSEAVTVVPDAASMPDGVVSQKSHNNLDIVWHRGRLFFAFRTGPSHFADDEVVMYVVSTTDQQTWTLETSIALGKDLREPRFLTLGDKLFLYLARLGEVTLTFKPESMMVTESHAGCVWTEPVDIEPTGEPGFIPWRAREIDGVGYLIGYVGGENIYDMAGDGIRVHWLKTTDGRSFEPVVNGQSVVLSGGVSETDWVFIDDGGLLAVTRNEAGDSDGFGSKICRASATDLGDWSCVADRKKYDSPVMFRHGAEVYLIGRRQLANDGAFDLEREDLSFGEQGTEYQTSYWSTPKRCSLWRVDPDTLSVEWVLDLPSNGDTCFASVLPLSAQHYLVYNYSSPLDDPQLAWNDGQWGDTYIYRLTLMLP
jgi:hypothetical protein